jgi:cell wall hydrolase
MGRITKIAAVGLTLAVALRWFYMKRQIDILARTIWGEARGEGLRGMQAVANVIVNRANQGGWWGDSIATVALKDKQFSVWNDETEPNTVAALNVDDNDLQFIEAISIAKEAVEGTLPDITGGATNYHADYVSPYWADSSKITATIGKHIFYEGLG